MNLSTAEKRMLIDKNDLKLSVANQCKWVGLSRASYYYEARNENPENLALMDQLDKLFTDHPYFGVLRMTHWFHRKG